MAGSAAFIGARSGGETPDAYRNINLSTTGQMVSTVPANLYALLATNGGAAAAFVKVYNKASAATQADTPVFTFRVPAGGSVPFAQPAGVHFNAGISLRATTGVADSDTGAPGANEVIVNALFKQGPA